MPEPLPYQRPGVTRRPAYGAIRYGVLSLLCPVVTVMAALGGSDYILFGFGVMPVVGVGCAIAGMRRSSRAARPLALCISALSINALILPAIILMFAFFRC